MSDRYRDKLHAVRIDPDPKVGSSREVRPRDNDMAKRDKDAEEQGRRQAATYSHDHPLGFRRRKGKGIHGARDLESAVPRLLLCGFVKPILRILASLCGKVGMRRIARML